MVGFTYMPTWQEKVYTEQRCLVLKSRQEKSCQANTLVLMFLFVYTSKNRICGFFSTRTPLLWNTVVVERRWFIPRYSLWWFTHTAETPVVFVYAKDSLVSNEYKYVGFCAASRGKHSCVIALSGTERLLPCHNLNTRFQKRQEYYTLQKADLQYICDTKASFFRGSSPKQYTIKANDINNLRQ